jgi:glucoamylase
MGKSASDGWADTHTVETTMDKILHLWFTDSPTAALPDGSKIEFTFFWKDHQNWQGRNYLVAVISPR